MAHQKKAAVKSGEAVLAAAAAVNPEFGVDNTAWLDKKLGDKGIWGKVVLNLVEWLPVVALLYFFALLKFYGMRAASSDENIYFYMGWAMNHHGAIPYRDYFFAHPPLQILMMAGWIALFGFQVETAKILPWMAFIVSGIFFHRLLRVGHSRISSFLGLLIYCYAYDVLRSTAHFTGINCTVMFLVAGLWAMWRYKNALSGVFFSLAALVGTYAMPAGGMGLLWVAFGRGKKATWRYVAGLATPYVLASIVEIILAGPSEWFNSQFRYHVIKPEQGGEALKRFMEINYDNHLLALAMWAGGLYVIITIFSRLFDVNKASAKVYLAAIKDWAMVAPHRLMGIYATGNVLIYLTFYFNLKRVFPFYYMLVFSSMAWLGSFMIEEGIFQFHAFQQKIIEKKEIIERAVTTVVVLVIVFSCYFNRESLGQRFHAYKPSTRASHYTWHDAPYYSRSLNDFMRKVAWVDVSQPGHTYNAVTRLLWHETFYIDEVYEVAKYIKANTKPEDRLFGDSTSLPLIAILADRQIIDDFADTNIMRFRSKLTNPNDTIRKINRSELAYVIPRKQTGFFRINEFKKWVDRDFILEKTLKESYGGLFMIYRRRVAE